ncbi:ATPase, T2SS/T4P/T4SS family [Ramlibacter sp. AN1015]|uniref:GspE/PulE family protein n=1 Tax=Ramlibacter sp. AN1015 TaxID=3133428 RepID=UPI0030C0BE54
MLPPGGERLAAQARFYRKLQQVTARIHDTEDLEHLMLDVGADICDAFEAVRLTLYAVTEDRRALVSRIKTGLNGSRALRLPVGTQSIAGFVAMTCQPLNLADAYDTAALQRIHPELSLLPDVDRASGFRTREMMALPIVEGDTLWGVLQIINHRTGRPFSQRAFEGAMQLCHTLATALRRRVHLRQDVALRKPTRYDGLLSAGLLSPQELQQALLQARTHGHCVENVLLSEYDIPAAQIGASLSRFFGVPYEPYQRGRIRSGLLQGLLRREFVEEHGWIPLEDSPDGLVLMCRDPEAVRSSRVVPQVFPRFARLAWRVTTLAEFDKTLHQFYGAGEEALDEMLAEAGGPQGDEGGNESLLESAAADNELVKFVNKLIIEAHQQRASDIHVEPLPGKGRTGIRFRIDGVLQPYTEVPAHFRQALITRLKIMCDLDISERRRPQDGKICFRRFGPLDIELRVATVPTAGGVEDVVIRLLSAGEPMLLEQLELSARNLQLLRATVGAPHGLFYVCGPTGSGKTTTLHSILHHLNTPGVKIWTAEDPVEITQRGLRQVQVHRKAGIDFAVLMRAFLRADPDIIMVGESRDAETVAMGVEASLTGHLVFSTLHTNSAPESIVRLLDMGMDPFNFADALLGVLAQRLARRLCACKEEYLPEADELRAFIAEYSEELRATPAWQADPAGAARRLYEGWVREHGQRGRLRLWRAGGCPECRNTGYRGRIALHELLVADAGIKHLIQTRAPVRQIFAACVEGGMHSLKMDGMDKVLRGHTDLTQVRAVCLR